MATFGIVSAFYKPHMGGVETFTENLALQLIHVGHRVIVITSLEQAQEPIEQHGDFAIVRLPSRAMMQGRFPLLLPGREAKAVEAWLSKQGIEGMLVNTRYYPISLFGLRFASKNRIPAIVLDHSSGPLSIGSHAADFVLRAYERVMTRRCLRYAPSFYAVSKGSARWLNSIGINAAGILRNAIDANGFRSMSSSRDFCTELELPHNAFFVCYAGRLLREKGVMKAAQAVAGLGESYPDIHLIIAGEGPAEADLRRSLSKNTHLVGRLSRPDLAALLCQSQVFCFPSDYPEGLPTALLEASACECGLIVSRTGGVDEVLPSSQFGILLESTEASAIQRAIIELYEDGEKRQIMAQNARYNACINYTWEKTAEDFIRAITC